MTPEPMYTTIVACSADTSHIHDACVGLPQSADLIQGVHYLQFLHPGGYVVDESLDALIDLVNRYGSPHVCVITHTNCGLVASSHVLANDADSLPEFFPHYTSGVLSLLKANGVAPSLVASMTDHDIAVVLARLIVTRVSRHFIARDNSSQVEISAAISEGDGNEPQVVIERTPVLNAANTDYFATHV